MAERDRRDNGGAEAQAVGKELAVRASELRASFVEALRENKNFIRVVTDAHLGIPLKPQEKVSSDNVTFRQGDYVYKVTAPPTGPADFCLTGVTTANELLQIDREPSWEMLKAGKMQGAINEAFTIIVNRAFSIHKNPETSKVTKVIGEPITADVQYIDWGEPGKGLGEYKGQDALNKAEKLLAKLQEGK